MESGHRDERARLKGAFTAGRRTWAVAIVAASSLFGFGCGGPDFIATGGAGTTSTTGQGGTTSAGGVAGSTQGGGGAGGSTTHGGGGTGGSTTHGGGGTGGATQSGECETAADCTGVKNGAPACGTWACNAGVCQADSPGCTDEDGDGYGTGASCTCNGIDCDDTNAAVHATSFKACYSGPQVTLNVGVCHEGVSSCTAGVWSPCGGEVTPSGEACNNQDDDCNGQVDDNLGTFTCGLGACLSSVPACTNGVAGVCKPGSPPALTDACGGGDEDCDGAVDEDCGCVYVSYLSVSASPDGTALNPFPTIQPAIDWAAAHPQGPQTVCVAAGLTCGAQHTYASKMGETVVMANGVSVLGNYESTLWTRCPGLVTTTTIQPMTAAGVTFPATVVKTTALDGFRIDRFQAMTTAAVTVDGAKGAILNNLTIPNGPSVTSSVGVLVMNGAEATVTGSRIDAGNGTMESIGVRSFASKVTIQNNCAQIDPNTGHCIASCFNGPTQQPSIVGRANGTGTTYGVLLESSPGSKIETSAICRTQADTGAAIRVVGPATGVEIRANVVNGFGGLQASYGVWLDDCGDAAPWIVDNEIITTQGANGNTVVNAIRSMGACHPVIDGNKQILGGSEGQAHNPIGIYCGQQNGVASKCTIVNNASIRGSGTCFPPTSVGIRCDDGGCNRIANNALITGRGAATDSVGVWLGATGTSVENNVIQGGCPGSQGTPGTATGVRTDDSYARLENNRIFGYTVSDCNCGNPANPGFTAASYGLRSFVTQATPNEIDVHSNDIDGTGPANVNTCVSRGVAIDLPAGVVMGKHGIFRNNILRAGTCSTSRVGFYEALAGADPRIVENNDFDPANGPTALYFDEGSMMLTTAAQVNLLGDITTAMNLSVDPQFVAYPTDMHLQGGSLCVDAGTALGAPALDMDGKARDASPDIGADEL